MKLKSLLSILHTVTKVSIFYEYTNPEISDYRIRGFYKSGYPARLYESISDDILNLQVLYVRAMALDDVRIVVIKRK